MKLQLGFIIFCFLFFQMNSYAAPKAVASPAEIVGNRVGREEVSHISRTVAQIKGGRGLVIEKLGLSGKPLTRMISWADKFLVVIDRGGKGQMEEWEYFDNDSHIRMSSPYAGHFQGMSVDIKTQAKILSLQFERNTDGEFQLIGSTTQSDTIQFSEETKPSEEKNDESLAGSQPSVKDRISAVLKSSLAHDLGHVVDHGSCQQELPALQKGVERVLLPDVRAQADETSEGLRCLRDFGFDTLADFVDSRFFSPALFAASGESSWSIRCDACQGDGNCRDGKQAVFRSRNSRGVPELSFLSTPTCKDASCRVNESQAAHLFLHEMVHASGVRSELFAEAASECCAPASDGQSNCRRLENLAKVRNREQAYQILYQQLSPETHLQIATLQKQILPAADNLASTFSGFLVNLAAEHQAVIDGSSASAVCSNEASEGCQKALAASTVQAFDKSFTSHCTSTNSSCRTASKTLSHIVIPEAPAGANAGGRPVVMNWPTGSAINSGLAAPTGKMRYRAPIGQLSNSAVSAGQNSLGNLQASGGPTQKFASEGPAMPFYSSVEPTSARAASMIAHAANDQADLIDSFMKRIGRLASSLLSPSSAQAAGMKVPDPSSDALSAHLKKVLNHDKTKSITSSGSAKTASNNATNGPSPQVLVDQLLALDAKKMKSQLQQKKLLSDLAKAKIGVLDETNSRLDQTQSPEKWLIYDAETRQFIFRDSSSPSP